MVKKSLREQRQVLFVATVSQHVRQQCCLIHKHQLESANTSLPTLDCRVKDASYWIKDSRVFSACWILIGQFKFQTRQPYARLEMVTELHCSHPWYSSLFFLSARRRPRRPWPARRTRTLVNRTVGYPAQASRNLVPRPKREGWARLLKL